MSFDIRPATLADSDAITAILTASYSTLLDGFYGADILAGALPIMSKAQPDLLTSGTYYTATIEDKIVACGGWTLAVPGGGAAEPDPDIAHIRHVATHPDHLRKGLAKAIMARCFHDARAAGVARFSCFSSLAAVPFYESVGFVAGAQKTVSFAPDLPFAMIIMTRDLQP